MNKEIGHSALAKLVAEDTGINAQTVDAFIKQLFIEVENKMIEQSLVRLDDLGLFRIIRSGDTKRILFLGATKKEESPSTVKPLSSINERIDRKGINKLSDITTITTTSRISAKPAGIDGEPLPGKPINNVDKENNKPVDAANEKIVEDRKIQENKKNEPVKNNTVDDTSPKPVYRPGMRKDISQQNEQPKPRKPLLRLVITGVIVVLLLAVAFWAFFMKSWKEHPLQAENPYNYNNNTHKFTEIENEDPKNVSRIIVLDQDVSLKQLAQIYYGDDKFWPYLFKANENIIVDGYVIPARSIVKIPKITIDLVEFTTGQLNDKLNSLAEEVTLKALHE